jgi:hypothetical protein
MVRYCYTPQQTGWIVVTDSWHVLMCAIDCRDGGTQRAFNDLCVDFERAGWELGERSFDSRFIRRNALMRWQVLITQANPFAEQDRRGYMSALADEREPSALACLTLHRSSTSDQAASAIRCSK